MNNDWYSWYPGMPEIDCLVQYITRIRTNISNVTGSVNLNTIITLRWGDILCSGSLCKKHILYELISKAIKENEKGCKHDLLEIRGNGFTVSMERQLLCI